MPKLLLVEDDPAVREPLATYLRSQGFETIEAQDLKSARAAVAAVELVILDWNLPDGEGPDLLREWRAGGIQKPVIFLTAHIDLVDRVLGLESGAQDYVLKPFEPRELLARVRVHLRKAPAADTSSLEAHGIRLDPVERKVTFKGQEIELAKKEFDLLHLLLENRGKVFSREELLNRVWGFENFPSTRTVDTHILLLRQKTSEDLFETIRGVGYRMKK